jgi:ribose transport system permease protein
MTQLGIAPEVQRDDESSVMTESVPNPKPVHERWSVPPWPVLGARYGLFGVWGIMIAVFGVLRPSSFLTLSNFQGIFDSQSLLLFLALGLVISLISGDFNLALPGVFSSSMVLLGVLNGNDGVPWGLAVLAAIAMSVFFGIVHAILIVKLRLSSFIVTLGSGTALLGLAYAISPSAISNLSPSFQHLATQTVFGFQLVFVYALVMVIVLWYVYKYTPLGRQLYFVGASKDVARLAGLNVNRLRTASLIASSAMGGLAAVVGSAYLGSSDPNLGTNFLLPMFASTLLGSTAVTPGRPNAWGTAAAAYFLVTGYSGLELLGLSGWVEQVFYGSALVVATLFASLISRRIGGGDGIQVAA